MNSWKKRRRNLLTVNMRVLRERSKNQKVSKSGRFTDVELLLLLLSLEFI